jgi:hypothetical protein
MVARSRRFSSDRRPGFSSASPSPGFTWHSILPALRVLAVAVQLRHCTRAGAIVAAVFGAGPRIALTALVGTLACSALLCHGVLLSAGDLRAQTFHGEMQRSGLST